MKYFLPLSLFLMSSIAQSEILHCTGTVNEVQTLSTGIVRLQTEGTGLDNRVYICNTDGSWGGISEPTCKAWISYAQLALASNKSINIAYDTDSYSACSELPYNSASLAPYLVTIKKN